MDANVANAGESNRAPFCPLRRRDEALMLFVGSSALGAPRSHDAPEKHSQRSAVVAGPKAQSDSFTFAAFAFKEFWDIQAVKNSGKFTPRLLVAWTSQDSGDANFADTRGSNRVAFRAPHRQDECSCPLVGSSALGTPRSRGAPKRRSSRAGGSGRSRGTIRFVLSFAAFAYKKFWDIQAAKNSEESWHSCPENVMPAGEHDADRSGARGNGSSLTPVSLDS